MNIKTMGKKTLSKTLTRNTLLEIQRYVDLYKNPIV